MRHDGKYFFNILLDFYQCTSVISSHLKENTDVDFEEKFIQYPSNLLKFRPTEEN